MGEEVLVLEQHSWGSAGGTQGSWSRFSPGKCEISSLAAWKPFVLVMAGAVRALRGSSLTRCLLLQGGKGVSKGAVEPG